MEDLKFHTRYTNHTAKNHGLFLFSRLEFKVLLSHQFPKQRISHLKATMHSTAGSFSLDQKPQKQGSGCLSKGSSVDAVIVMNCLDLIVLSHEVVDPRQTLGWVRATRWSPETLHKKLILLCRALEKTLCNTMGHFNMLFLQAYGRKGGKKSKR